VVALVKAVPMSINASAAAIRRFMLAVAGRSDRSAKALLDHGADVNARNTGGITALMIAAAANEADLASLLIKSWRRHIGKG